MKHIWFFAVLTAVTLLAACSEAGAGSEEYVYVGGISLNGDAEKTLQVGETYELTVTITPANASEKGIIWKSIQPRVALVFADGPTGTVMAFTPGETIIMAVTEDGGFMASVTITVQ
jgi:uncharacterized protein YjdB